MKKLLSLLSVLTISGTAIPITIAASPYQKEETIDSHINYQQINNLKNLSRNKRQKDCYVNYGANRVYNVQEQVNNGNRITNFRLGSNNTEKQIINAFVNQNNIQYMRDSLEISSGNFQNQSVEISALSSRYQARFTGNIGVNYNSPIAQSSNSNILESVRIDMSSLNNNLGEFRILRNGAAQNEIIIDRFLEINRLPRNLINNFQVLQRNGNSTSAQLNIKDSFIINNNFYSSGQSGWVNYSIRYEEL